MKTDSMKNIVVLRNLPSNMIEEALIILKPGLKVKEINHIKKNSNDYIMNDKKINSNEYIIKEAELLVANYISDIEKKNQIFNERNMNKKYQRLKKFSIVLTIILSISLLIQFFIK